jgi:hypothetical protein
MKAIVNKLKERFSYKGRLADRKPIPSKIKNPNPEKIGF